MATPTTRVYIDGFNLYHGIIRPNRLHWLNLQSFAERLNRGQTVDRVLYFTAMVSASPTDPDKAQRQDVYHRALAIACPKVEIVKGQFTSHGKLQRVACCASSPSCAIRVVVRNEKGSDVNLASRLLHDGHLGRYDRAIVVSGDSDLTEPVRLITQELHKDVWVQNPRDVSSQELEAVATDYRRIRPGVLQGTQLPDPVSDGTKNYSCPPKWTTPPAPKPNKQTIVSAACSLAGCNRTIKTCRYT
jgi:hypothetical protein